MVDIVNVINVSLSTQGRLATPDNMNICVIMTDEVDGPVSTLNRFEVYRNIDAVAVDFGTQSKAYTHAAAFFATKPNPDNAGGYLAIGFWRSVQEDVAASPGTNTGAELDDSTLIVQLQAISDGTLDIPVDAGTENLTALDFRVALDLDGVVTVLNAALSGATASLINANAILITSDTTGASSVVGLTTNPGTGTYVGDLLKLSAGSGAVIVAGLAANNNALETKLAGLTAVKAVLNFKGFVFIDTLSDAEVITLGTYAQANDVLGYETFTGATALDIDVTEPIWINTLAGRTNFRCLYSPANNRLMSASYMARMHTVNFNAENSALTMHLKELSIPSEEFSEGDVLKALNVGADIYPSIKQTPLLLTSGANDFTDNRYNLLAYQIELETDGFNFLKATGTKVPQTTPGVQSLVDVYELATKRFVKAGVFAPGTWTSSDRFGDEETFDRSILQLGYYFLAGLLSDQSAASRANREAPVIQGAVKLAGAIHKSSVIVNVNT